MNKLFVCYITVLCCGTLFIGCAGTSPPAVVPATPALGNWETGDVDAGRALFAQRAIARGAGCTTCHALDPNVTLVGPSLYGVATAAETREAGTSAPLYLYRSIVAPNEHIVDGYSADAMPTTYGASLTAEELTNLVSFLMTLTADQ